jgi:hypothetical protein
VVRVFCPSLLVFAVACVSCNCSKSRPHSGQQREVPAAASEAGLALAKPKPFQCESSAGNEAFTLGSTDGADEDDDSGVDVPFAINVGDGLAFDGGFAVTAIDGRAGNSQALLAVMTEDAHQGRKIDLGRVFGDADPPHVAGNSQRLVVAIADMDAAGRTLSLARVDAPLKQPIVTRGGEISVAGTPSTLFSLAVNGERGVLVWDQQESHADNGEIALAPFATPSLALPAKPVIISGKRASADSPRVIARPGGYWVAWVQAGSDSKAPSKPGASPSQQARAVASEDNLNLVDMGTRELRALLLDAAGHPTGKPLRVAEGVSHVVAYDMNLLDDGAALFAWRDDDSAPGVESQIVRLARVGLDGHVDFYRIEDESIGVGAPQLLIDTSAAPEDRVWLALINTGERTSVIKLLPNGKPTGLVVGDADLGVANPLLRHQGRLLLVRQRGKGVDMEAIHCSLRVQGQPP